MGFQPYIPATGAPVPAVCPDWLERLGVWSATRPYLPPLAPSSVPPAPSPLALVGKAQVRAAIMVDVEIASPELGKGDGRAVAARTMVVGVPDGATRFRVTFSPASPASGCAANGGAAPAVFPVGLVEDASGDLAAQTTQLRLTPTWARLGDEPQKAGAVKATMTVEFT